MLLSLRAPVGRVNVADAECCIGRGIAAIRGDTALDSAFFGYLFESQQDRWAEHVSDGSVFPNLGKAQLEAMTIVWPPLSQRRRVVAVLRALDDKIEHNDEFADRLMQLASVIVRKACDRLYEKASIYEVAAVTYGAAFKSDLFGEEGTPLLRIRDLATQIPSVRTVETLSRQRVVTRSDVVVGMDGEFRAAR